MIQRVLNELTELYKEDEITLSQQLIWMEVFLERTDTIPQREKDKIQEKLSMYDQLWEENSKIKRIRAESKAQGIAEGEARGEAKTLQEVLVTTIELRFPALAELAEKQIEKPDQLTLLFRMITTASDENFVRSVLKSSAA